MSSPGYRPIHAQDSPESHGEARTTTQARSNRRKRSDIHQSCSDAISVISSNSTSGFGSIDSSQMSITENHHQHLNHHGDENGHPHDHHGHHHHPSHPEGAEETVEGILMHPPKPTEFTPPDGGVRAWLVMISSFLCNGIIFGTINSFGVVFVYLKSAQLSSAQVSLVGAMAVGATFLLSPISGILADRFGIRRTAFVGGLIAAIGMLASSFFVNRVAVFETLPESLSRMNFLRRTLKRLDDCFKPDILCFTYGILFGGGSSLCYTPSLVILGHYFRKKMGLVNGIVTAGSSIFTMAMPIILEGLLSTFGLSWTFRVLFLMTTLLVLASLTFKPLLPHHESGDEISQHCCSKIIKLENWKNRKYLIWSLAIPSALFGYFVPYVHIVQYVKDLLPENNGGSLVTCIGITSGLGRLIFGYIADHPRANRIFLQQISFVLIGICTMLLTAAPYFGSFTFQSMIIIALVMGLFDGCFITMLGPIAFDLCGPRGASQAIGFLLGLCSIPLTVGPPIAGLIYDELGSYTVAFLAAGCPPIIGAAFMCLIYFVKGPDQSSQSSSSISEENGVDETENLMNETSTNETGRMKAAPTETTIVSNNQEGERTSSKTESC